MKPSADQTEILKLAGDTLDDVGNYALLELLPVGVYVCDRDGLIIRYNRAAAELWGRSPRIGDPADRFCGSWRLRYLNGTYVPHIECPMAVALATGEGMRDGEIVVERPDGSRVVALVSIEVLKNADGEVTGAINVFRDNTEQYNLRIALGERKREFESILQALPAAIYTTDAEGRITFYNEAAAELWGVRPELGKSEFCGSWKLYWPDGTFLPHDECPMAMALKEKRPISGMEAAAERPDGERIPFLAFPTPLFDTAGELTGAVNMLMDIRGRKIADETAQRLAAIVESSDDAILSKDLNGIITSWNNGAERLYGYKAHEVIGQPVTILIPEDRQDEEPQILARIRRGDRIDHYETIRQHKDGTLIDISLTVSPLRDEQGRIVGASKIARNITERRLAEEQQRLLLREMNHRVKNLFTLSSSLVTLCARSAASTEELVSGVRERFAALAQAHTLTLPPTWNVASDEGQTTTLHTLIRSILLPFEKKAGDGEPRAVITGPDLPLGGSAVTNFALLLHEFATNAAKYGALSVPDGHVHIACSEDGDQFALTWRESGGPPIEREPADEGFGTLLTRATVKGSLGGRITRDWAPEGLVIVLSVARDQAMAR